MFCATEEQMIEVRKEERAEARVDSAPRIQLKRLGTVVELTEGVFGPGVEFMDSANWS